MAWQGRGRGLEWAKLGLVTSGRITGDDDDDDDD